ncbi:phospholipase A [Aquisalimonas lutea]|uniref:phospholipase A n=1 Tax=Aquisalimonas lutea TaxID=1327750 RepID=UPI0025B5E31D|nr:phospholipase A [Aquisalimonas lutea]MDN3515986.1 phospholipase A [Aquisalimonas lutea]
MRPDRQRPRTATRYLALAAFWLACSAAGVSPATGQDADGEPGPGEDSVRQEMASDDAPALTVHEPLYFVVGRGAGEDTKARFQLSFKYRILDRKSLLARNAPWLADIHFGYTQTSLWNWDEESAPFEDSSYRPSVFWQTGRLHGPNSGSFLRIGVEHESNGQAGDESRSLNTAFVQPGLSLDVLDRELLLAPTFHAYLDKGRYNTDIEDYRGYGDLLLRYGNDDSWVVQTRYRYGLGGHHTTQVDLSIPLRERIFARTGAYLYIQYFNGYGESLLGYDQQSGPTLRAGIAIVR